MNYKAKWFELFYSVESSPGHQLSKVKTLKYKVLQGFYFYKPIFMTKQSRHKSNPTLFCFISLNSTISTIQISPRYGYKKREGIFQILT